MFRVTHDPPDSDDDGPARDRFGNGDATGVGIASPPPALRAAGPHDVHVPLDMVPMFQTEPDALAGPGIVGPGQKSLKSLLDTEDHPVMEVGKPVRAFEVRVHSREG
ncbi:MAG TPA: hypothetical protein VKA15_13045 [Isosphaeraceae bacterium]|nr:hypothetical protein [Isosphaeraceae bacterium]